ncbi:MAG: TIGR02594 family protein, partial [Pseudorhodoplanes sp.]
SPSASGHSRQASRYGARYRPRGSAQPAGFSGGGFAGAGGGGLVAEARRYLGTNPTGRSRLWCGRFMNLVLERSGRKGTGSDMARSFANYGSRISGPQVGAIAVMSRGKGGGHVGIVSGVDAKGNPIIISGNHGRTVAESTYPRGRVYAYVMP